MTNQFEDYQKLLFGIAYRMLGTVADAEDIVQDAYLRWERNTEPIRNSKAWLVTTTTRLCVDQLKSAQSHRETYIGPWLPEPVQEDMASETYALSESLSMAFLVMLERLSSIERAVFLLREVFGYSHNEIAEITTLSSANARQVLRRAKLHLAKDKPRFNATLEEQQLLLGQFMQACMTGDIDGMTTLLVPEVTFTTDSNGKAIAARKVLLGSDAVVKFMTGVLKLMPENGTFNVQMLNNQPAVVIYENGQATSAITMHAQDGYIQAFYAIRNPDKLKGLGSLSL